VVLLQRKGLAPSEIAFAVGISERLTEEYLALYQRYNVSEYQARLAEMVQRVQGRYPTPRPEADVAKKGAL
jgi:hypothetical protein